MTHSDVLRSLTEDKVPAPTVAKWEGGCLQSNHELVRFQPVGPERETAMPHLYCRTCKKIIGELASILDRIQPQTHTCISSNGPYEDVYAPDLILRTRNKNDDTRRSSRGPQIVD